MCSIYLDGRDQTRASSQAVSGGEDGDLVPRSGTWGREVLVRHHSQEANKTLVRGKALAGQGPWQKVWGTLVRLERRLPLTGQEQRWRETRRTTSVFVMWSVEAHQPFNKASALLKRERDSLQSSQWTGPGWAHIGRDQGLGAGIEVRREQG